MSKHDNAIHGFEALGTFFDPWFKAANTFSAEAEAFQQALFAGAIGALDDSHKLARDGLQVALTVSATLRKQMTEHLERAAGIVSAL